MEISQVCVAKISVAVERPCREDYFELGRKLLEAFQSTGFVYVTGHGVGRDLIRECMAHSESFFKLSREEKKPYRRDPLTEHGYIEAGREVFKDTTSDVFHEIREASKHQLGTLALLKRAFCKVA